MKTLNQYIKEKLIINKDYHDTKIVVKSSDELRKIIEQRYEEYGPGTKRNPIDFNDIDVSNIDSFRDKLDLGIFNDMNFKYIDVSDWDVSNVTNMAYMFQGCNNFNQDISEWDVSKVTNMTYMFYRCKKFNQDLSKWNVSNVRYHAYTFYNCSIKEEYKPKFK